MEGETIMTTITLELGATIAILQNGDARIVDWNEDMESKVAVKNVPTKSTPTVETKVWTATPKLIVIKCRITEGEKDDLDSIEAQENETNQPLLKENGVTLHTVWIESINYTWKGDKNWAVPWIATIKLRVIS